MTTTTATAPPRLRVTAPGAYDRVFYSSMALVMALTVFVGFAPTYYLRSYFGAPATVTGAETLSTLAQVHGALFTGWVLLFIVQTALVAQRRLAVHRRLGVAGAVLAATMVAVGTWTAVASAARGATVPGVDPLAFLVVPVTDMVLFAGFVAAALVRRKDKESHKRLMLLAYISIIVAAVARFPGMVSLGPPAFFGLAFVFLVVAVAYDAVTRGKIHRVYIWGGALLVLSVPIRLAVSETGAWMAVARLLTS